MKNIISPVKGTRDFYPEEMAVRRWLYRQVGRVAELFGYQEWEGPILETLELYAAKSGEELVKEQAFVFPDRRGELIALRPELTPTLARMVAQRQRQLVYPLRWWSFGPFWRYEQPQRGRTREFFQWNVDLIGVDSPEADAELIAMVATFLQQVGLSPQEVVIRVNNRALMDQELAALGVAGERRGEVSNLIDRRSKLSAEKWEAGGLEIGLHQRQVDDLKILLGNDRLWEKSAELTRLFAALEALGVSEYVRYDANTVRGLLYYTGTVFEAYEVSGELRRALLGGGRYDNLLADVGGDPLPATGFAMGDVVMTLLLEKYGLLPRESQSPAGVLVTVFDAERMPASLALAAELRRAGLAACCYPDVARLPKQFKYADRMGMRAALVLGPDELSNGQVTIKDLRRGSQRGVDREAVVREVQEMVVQGENKQ